jgi:hypothetical protein
VLVVAGSGCVRRPQPPPCGADQPRLLVVRDARGVEVRSVVERSPTEHFICENASLRVTVAGDVALSDTGALLLRRSDDTLYDATGPRYRVYAGPEEWRLLHLDGIAVGGVTGHGGRAQQVNAAGLQVGFIEQDGASGSGRLLVLGSDRTLRFALTGHLDVRQAGLVTLPTLSTDQGLIVWLLWPPAPGSAIGRHASPDPLQKDAAP